MDMKNPRRQIFPFRWPIMKYILKNPKVWKKLIKTCKYFFAQYPVYPVERLTKFDGWWNANNKKFDPTKPIAKLWIFDILWCECSWIKPSAFSNVISKVFKFDLRFLRLNNLALTFESYQILTSSGSVKELHLLQSTVKFSNDEDVKMDKLFENLPNIKDFYFVCKLGSKIFEKDTVKKMKKILCGVKDLRYFELENLDETFDLFHFMDFLMKNETVTVSLHYVKGSQLSAAFAHMLDACFEKLVANPPKKLVKIFIHGFVSDKYLEYCNLRDGRK